MICLRAARYLVARIQVFWDLVQGCLRLFILTLNSSIIPITINIVINILLVRYIKAHLVILLTTTFFLKLSLSLFFWHLITWFFYLFDLFFLLHHIPLIIYLRIILKLILTLYTVVTSLFHCFLQVDGYKICMFKFFKFKCWWDIYTQIFFSLNDKTKAL